MTEEKKAKQRVYNKKHYELHKEKRLALNKKRTREIKDFVFALRASGTCPCGESDPSCLDYHHIDSSTKEIEISQAVRLGWSNARILEEIEKCVLICANCHRKEHARSRNSTEE